MLLTPCRPSEDYGVMLHFMSGHGSGGATEGRSPGPSPAHNSVDCRGLLMCDTTLR